MKIEIQSYNNGLSKPDKDICDLLYSAIGDELIEAENKIWHAHPVWFLDNNPIVGYSKLKDSVQLMFWSGADFKEEKLNIRGKKFKDASIRYKNVDEINTQDVQRWLKKAKNIQWDYRNLIKRKGGLKRIK